MFDLRLQRAFAAATIRPECASTEMTQGRESKKGNRIAELGKCHPLAALLLGSRRIQEPALSWFVFLRPFLPFHIHIRF